MRKKFRLRWIRDCWIICGITLLLLMGIEASLTLIYLIKDTHQPREIRYLADTYENEPWAYEYFKEFAEARRLNWRPYTYWSRQPLKANISTLMTMEPGKLGIQLPTKLPMIQLQIFPLFMCLVDQQHGAPERVTIIQFHHFSQKVWRKTALKPQ